MARNDGGESFLGLVLGGILAIVVVLLLLSADSGRYEGSQTATLDPPANQVTR